MMIHPNRFNLYLLVACCLVLISGCKTTDSKSQEAILRVHLEVNRDGSNRYQPVPIDRDQPFMVNVENEPFLTEANVKEARVIDVIGGFAIRIQFDRRGTWLLEQYTADNPGKHLAIFSQFVSGRNKKVTTGRWLAAPLITGRIANGVLTFTPDASRDEAYQIVLGLNNVARKNGQQKG